MFDLLCYRTYKNSVLSWPIREAIPPPAIPKRVQTLGLWTATQIRCKTNLYFVLYKNEYGGLSDCEELVGGYLEVL